MISLRECATASGLAPGEQLLGVAPADRHHRLLSSYLLNLSRGPVAVRDMIVVDLRGFHELGALRYAADLLLVLRLFLTEHPEARFGRRRRLSLSRLPLRGCSEGNLTEALCWLCDGAEEQASGRRSPQCLRSARGARQIDSAILDRAE